VLWIDLFNLTQLALVLVSVAESVLVHYLLKTQRDRLAMSIDRILRITLPWLLYPVVTLATILYGLEQAHLCPGGDDSVCGLGRSHQRYLDRERVTGRTSNYNIAVYLATFGVAWTILLSAALIWVRVIRVAREQILSILCLLELLDELGRPAAAESSELSNHGSGGNDHSEEHTRKLASQWAGATERVFKVYDLDDSGAIDFKELRLMLQRMYPNAHGTLLRSAMQLVRPYADSDGDLDVVAFQDARLHSSNHTPPLLLGCWSHTAVICVASLLTVCSRGFLRVCRRAGDCRADGVHDQAAARGVPRARQLAHAWLPSFEQAMRTSR
jgi:hypothetical protein